MKRKKRADPPANDTESTPKRLRSLLNDDAENNPSELEGSPTPKAKSILKTPTKSFQTSKSKNIPSTRRKADRSAKRKSASTLLLHPNFSDDENDSNDFGAALAQEILADSAASDDNDEEDEEQALAADGGDDLATLAASALQETPTNTPSKKGRGRPKGSKNRRSPTPDTHDLAPEERYFFQNRGGPPEVSSHTLSSLKLLSHDEYHELMRSYRDPHADEVRELGGMHARAYAQWRFELSRGFGVCLYGWGSKRGVVSGFAEYLCQKALRVGKGVPKVVVVNGYTAKISARSILGLVAKVAMGEEGGGVKLGAQPAEMLDTILSFLDERQSEEPIVVLINSIDSTQLRKQATQALLARLAAHKSIHLLATADTPSFPLLWDSNLRDQYAFVFHDCTTYAPYTAELNVVDDVHELLGRKGRRIGGGEGIGFVLRSLTENSRKLYVLLLTEVLSALAEGAPAALLLDDGDEEAGEEQSRRLDYGQDTDGEIGIEYKMLYQKASENFVCSSEMNFRTLLKEFYDHQMIVSRKDGSGAEVLGVPLSKEEMETLLEGLIMAGN